MNDFYSYTDTLAIIEEVLGLDSSPSLTDSELELLAFGTDLEAEEELDFHDCF